MKFNHFGKFSHFLPLPNNIYFFQKYIKFMLLTMVKESHFCHKNNDIICHFHHLCFSIFVLFNFVSNTTENWISQRINNTIWKQFHMFHSLSVEEWKSIWKLRMKLSNGRTRWYEMILKMIFISTVQLRSYNNEIGCEKEKMRKDHIS